MNSSAAKAETLRLEDLSVSYRISGADRAVLRGLSFGIAPGEAYGLVGESGCGKSTVALSIARYLPPSGSVTSGSISLAGQDVMHLSSSELRRMRASQLSMVYQDASKALNPSMRIGPQLAEVYELAGLSSGTARARSIEMLRNVRISDPSDVMQKYPHQLSGGMQQRVAIAMALASNPAMLILDEPTTGLDATVESEVLGLISDLKKVSSASLLFISHNLAAVAGTCDKIGVLYAGMLVEEGPAELIFKDPRHPYTVALLRCLPQGQQRKGTNPLDTIPGFLPNVGASITGCPFADRCALATDLCHSELPPLHDLGDRKSRCHYHEKAQTLPRAEQQEQAAPMKSESQIALLNVSALSKTYQTGEKMLRAVSDVSLALMPGQTLGIVGESGSGKTTLAKMLLGLITPDHDGSISLNGKKVPRLLAARDDGVIKAIQMVFQNPDSALNRAHSVGYIITRALKSLGKSQLDVDRQVDEIMRSVRLTPQHKAARPRQLSGGLKQRVAIARAFAGDPELVVCDEPTSALDVSVQAAILNLLVDLQAKKNVGYIFISHDLAVVRYISDQVLVLYLGQTVEQGPTEAVFSGPNHPYTEALFSAAPRLSDASKAHSKLLGEQPSRTNPPPGCIFSSRCPRKIGDICDQEEPTSVEASPGHFIRCHIPPSELANIQKSPSMVSHANS